MHHLANKAIDEIKLDIKKRKEDRFRLELACLSEQLSFDENHSLLQAREKGASSWLTALPVERQGYILNKREFRDSIALRYGFKIQDVPQ